MNKNDVKEEEEKVRVDFKERERSEGRRDMMTRKEKREE